MKLTCLINSHNYAAYVGQAVDSAIAQVRRFDQIIVIDDGSSDDSVDLIRRRFGHLNHVRLIAKPQAGQLSCFHESLDAISGDVVFFLDADDCYQPDLTRHAEAIYRDRRGVDFLSVGFEEFGVDHRISRQQTRTRDRGLSVLSTILHRYWIGNPTSCLSMRTSLLKRLLPYPHPSDWQTRADDVLVFGASIAGAHKYHLEMPLVRYRIHDNNHHARRSLAPADKYAYALRVNRMIQHYVQACGYDMQMLPYLLPREFRTLQSPTWQEYRQYCRMSSRGRLPLNTRLEQMVSMLSHYAKQRWSADRADRPVDAATLHRGGDVITTAAPVSASSRAA